MLLAIVALRRVPLPRGSVLIGSFLYGALGFGAAFGFIYWGLVRTPAGLAPVILALVPLLAFLLAVGQGLEHFRRQSLAGALLALVGIAIVFSERVGAGAPLGSMLAVLAAACMAESNVVVKRFPKCHPVANNAIAMGTGAAILLALSVVAGDAHVLPTETRTWTAVAYVSLAGSVAVFSLFLFVIQRWTASSTSYVMLLMPLVTVVLGAALAGESITPAFLAGGAFVLSGVYVGAFAPPIFRLRGLRAQHATSASRARSKVAAEGQGAPFPTTVPVSSTPIQPGCA
ncbi:MAG: EamA family transporter [Chloroflexota bacterium]|nr:EamA family transporter [Chloroflexota bacterium]